MIEPICAPACPPAIPFIPVPLPEVCPCPVPLPAPDVQQPFHATTRRETVEEDCFRGMLLNMTMQLFCKEGPTAC